MFLYFYEPNFTTNGIRNFMTQQKQRKQPILIDGKNIFTYCFQPIQPLQPNFTTDGIRNFMAQQKQRKQPILIDGKNIFTYCFQPIQPLQPNFTTCTTQCYQSYIANNKPNTKFLLIQLRQRKFCSIHIQVSNNFVHFIHHQYVHFIDPEKPVRGFINNFIHFIHPYMNPLAKAFQNTYCRTAF